MIQYDDLTLDDLWGYWGNSALLYPRRGRLLACKIRPSKVTGFPIDLQHYGTSEHLVNLRKNTFLQSARLSFPELGYGWYEGVAVLLAPVAGADRAKGLNLPLLRYRIPDRVQKWSRRVYDNEHAELYKKAQKSGSRLAIDNRFETLRRKTSLIIDASDYIVGRANNKEFAKMLEGVVNDEYPPIMEAIKRMAESLNSCPLSKNVALYRDSFVGITAYHRMTPIGKVSAAGVLTISKRIKGLALDILTRQTKPLFRGVK